MIAIPVAKFAFERVQIRVHVIQDDFFNDALVVFSVNFRNHKWFFSHVLQIAGFFRKSIAVFILQQFQGFTHLLSKIVICFDDNKQNFLCYPISSNLSIEFHDYNRFATTRNFISNRYLCKLLLLLKIPLFHFERRHRLLFFKKWICTRLYLDIRLADMSLK